MRGCEGVGSTFVILREELDSREAADLVLGSQRTINLSVGINIGDDTLQGS